MQSEVNDNLNDAFVNSSKPSVSGARSPQNSIVNGLNSNFSLASITEDERRLLALGYKQEVKRIFSAFTNFGLAASMISVLLGVVPLYTYQLQTGGPVIMFWSWIVVGSCTIPLVMCLGEICSAFPTMGALYFWAFKLGGEKWGPFASWIAGWCNLLGQIAGVASGAFAGGQIISELVALFGGQPSADDVVWYFLLMLVIAGIVNTFAEVMLTALCYISVAWQIVGVIVIVAAILSMAPQLQTASFVFTEFHQDVGFPGQFGYVALIGSLTAASTFTGYDTAAHVAEETTESHQSTPKAMLWAVYNCYILGMILIAGMNFCIQGSVSEFLASVQDDDTGVNQAYTILFRSTVGDNGAIAFLFIVLVAIECSNCANLTSAARMLYSFSRDGALPFSSVWYHIDPRFGGPVRAIWLSLAIAFILGLPGLGSSTVLSALFSLTATGLLASYVIPIFLRVTVARDTFQPREYNLGSLSIPMGIFSVFWGVFITIVLCLPQEAPISIENLNYSGIALGLVLLYALVSWFLSARHWYKVAVEIDLSLFDETLSPVPRNIDSQGVSYADSVDPTHVRQTSNGIPYTSSTIRSSKINSTDVRLSELQMQPRNSLSTIESISGANIDNGHANSDGIALASSVDLKRSFVGRRTSATRPSNFQQSFALDAPPLTESSSSSSSISSDAQVPLEVQLDYETIVADDTESDANRTTSVGVRNMVSSGHIEI